MEQRKRNRAITITFSKGFEEELEYVLTLKEKGINRSFWICQAVREKMQKDKIENELIVRLEQNVRSLEEQVKALEKSVKENRSNVVFLPQKDEETVEINDEDLIEAAMGFFGLAE